jgi:all-trans-retinol dehydrogenase (NAD+)
MKTVRGKVALVTGGALGMGREWCKHLAAEGARLAIWDINTEAMARTAEDLRRGGAEVFTQQVDVFYRERVYEAALELKRKLGEVDILVNNAGMVYASPFLEASDEKLAATIDVNVKSMFWTCKAFLPHMMERNEGHVVNVSSASGFIGVPYMPAYTASKWAVIGLTESLRLEMKLLGKAGIRWTLFCPSYVSTGLFEGARAPLLTPMLSPEEAVERAYKAFKRDTYLVQEPFLVKLTPALKTLLPTRVFDLVSDVLGATDSMRHWKGHEPEGPAPHAHD